MGYLVLQNHRCECGGTFTIVGAYTLEYNKCSKQIKHGCKESNRTSS